MTYRGAWCCDWPDCPFLAARRFRPSAAAIDWVNLCNPHARAWLAMSAGERNRLDRTPSRMIPAGPKWARTVLPLPPR